MPTPVISNIDNTNHTYQADGVNYALSPTTGRFELASSIPTKAPTGQTSVTQPVATPVSVASANPAKDQINNVIVPVMNNAQTAMANQQVQKQTTTISKKTNADGTSSSFMSDGTRVQTDAQGNIVPSQKTPEQQAIDTADVGMKFAYQSDGSRTQIGLNESAAQYGLSDTNPTIAPVKPVTATSELPSGTSFKQYQDGTYGRYDAKGTYQGSATQQDFQFAQKGQSTLDELKQTMNGNYPLTANQQAQVDSLKQMYTDLINKQTTANANFTGGTTVAQNMYGIGNTMMGMGQIQGVINDGLQKISSLQSEMSGAVAKMTQSFQDGHMQDLKDAYTIFSNSSKELQANFDKMHAEVVATTKDMRDKQAVADTAADNDIRTAIIDAQKGGASPAQLDAMQQALANHDMAAAVKAGGNSLLNSANGVIGEYNTYKQDALSRGVVPKSFADYQQWQANLKQKAITPGSDLSGNGSGDTRGSISADAQDVLEGRNTLANIRAVMGRSNQAAAYMKGLRDQIRSKDSNFDFIASDAGGKSVSQAFVQKAKIAINAVEPNIDKVIDLSNQVSRIGWTGVDGLLQKGQIQFGNQKVANFHEAQKLIADELGTALGAGTMSDMKLQLGFDVTSPNVSKEVFASNMKVVKDFLNNRKQALDDLRYKSSTTGGGTTVVGDTAHPLVQEQLKDPLNLGVSKTQTNNNALGI